MYLKKIEIHGFKSFADKVNVTFEQGITGIVGPNGCGKSNISDAVRWVLGEQSVKSLRGASMSDIIFAGSQDRKAQNVAEVTLVFDNSDRFVAIEYDEIEITRRIYRHGKDAEYLINRQICRLKDVVDLIMDTGLGRNSLSIISQGNISSFADSKPDERRMIFEEAAGVSKYKKRKLESIRKLERTKENLERINDIVAELEKQVGPLKRQKQRAEQYVSLKEQLTEIEINVLATEITSANTSLEELKKHIKDLTEKHASIEADILLNDNANDECKKKMFTLDSEVNELQTTLFEAMNAVSNLETTKIEVDQKRKYLMQQTNPDDLKEKARHLKEVLSEALHEYNDRVERFNNESSKIKEMQLQLEDANRKLSEKSRTLDTYSHDISKSKLQKEMIEDAMKNKTNLHYGVKSILESSKNNPGIIGIIEDLIQPISEYDIAITTALAGSTQFIVTKNEEYARNAISFLKKNKAGRATFLPTTVMKPRTVNHDHMLVLQTLKGYLGVASDFVEYDKQIGNVVANLLGNVVICDTLENANIISKSLFNRYKIVTMSGDVVNVGGSMTGGSAFKKTSTNQQSRELKEIEEFIGQKETMVIRLKNDLKLLDNESKELSHDILQSQMAFAKLEVVVQRKKENMMSIKAEYESITNQQVELDNFASGETENKLISELNEAISKRDELTNTIKSKRELRMKYVNENEQLESELRELRQLSKGIQDDITKNTINATKIESTLENHLQRLNEEYKMTYEFALEHSTGPIDIMQARQDVATLRFEIERLGNVNLDAIEEYKIVSERYETMDEQRLDLIQAQDTILAAIDEMDTIMVKQFSETFEKINVEFNEVFRTLFGGGKANIRYSDPTNILETGVDIDVQPPGKAVQNISLFSGGEKALIAISCLFAILKVRPIPLCILDEVEAALDIANVERFAKYLREFAKSSQFIVVTHREGMMEECDILYGATMQQKGVTKLVSVKLEEAKGLTEEM